MKDYTDLQFKKIQKTTMLTTLVVDKLKKTAKRMQISDSLLIETALEEFFIKHEQDYKTVREIRLQQLRNGEK